MTFNAKSILRRVASYQEKQAGRHLHTERTSRNRRDSAYLRISKEMFQSFHQNLFNNEGNIKAVKPSTEVSDVTKLMIYDNIGRIPVEHNKGKLIGIVDREDVARILLSEMENCE